MKINDMPQIKNKDAYVGACSNEAYFHSSINTSTISSSSFQIHLNHSSGNDGPLEGHQVLPSFKALHDVQEEMLSSGASSAKYGCFIALDSNTNSPREMLASDAMLNVSDGAVNLLMVKHKNCNLENDTSDNSTLQNGCYPVSSGVTIPGCLSDGSLQIPVPKEVVQ
ncbi:hypothetical protein V6N13_064364 [Hibiscus sabdariffa]|uniref:Uncharacterized protein n=1 Tax=Hibiscus sabdariffa TaxID=183260 RepID=A0ABR2E9U5_9ROSI